MKLLIGVKHVPDTETKIKIGGDGRSIDPTGVKWVASPYDEFAIEAALQLKEAVGEGEVVLVCAGPADAAATLRQGLAMGADRAVLIEDEAFLLADGLSRARALAAVARDEAPDLILLGKQGVGTDETQTGPMLAEFLGLPHVSAVGKFEVSGGRFTARREVEGAVEVHEGRLPAVLSIDKGINEPRYASLKGIMQAKKKTIDVRESVGLDAQSAVVWEALELPPPRPDGRKIDGEPADQARELVRILHEVEKVI